VTTDRHSIEQALCSLWAELLAVDVTPEDDFFELGGYSLLIVDVVAQARTYGITMSPDDVFDHRTPAAIATAIALRPPGPASRVPRAQAARRPAGGDAEPDPGFADVWATGRSPIEAGEPATLVPLVPEGTGTPVFCFHWGTGNVRFMGDVAKRFRGERRVYGLESVGLWSRERPPLSLTEVAARYLREISAVQPHGPYLLVGPCAGGRIAYEAARQLEQAGETVALLALVNSGPPGVTDLDSSWGLEEFYDLRMASLRHQLGVPSLNADSERVMATMLRASEIDEGTKPAELHWRQAVWAAGAFAQEHYEPRRYGGEAIVFQLAANARKDDFRWDRMIEATEVCTFDANDTLPLLQDQAFAATLRQKLAAFAG
jgi:thioesterase domain-containing protein/acyl carrier protein